MVQMVQMEMMVLQAQQALMELTVQ
jgi:hypothetical protein